MSNRVMIKPAPGLRVRDPKTLRWLRPEGEAVQWSRFWQRRLACGDVVEVAGKPAARHPDVETSASRAPTKEID